MSSPDLEQLVADYIKLSKFRLPGGGGGIGRAIGAARVHALFKVYLKEYLASHGHLPFGLHEASASIKSLRPYYSGPGSADDTFSWTIEFPDNEFAERVEKGEKFVYEEVWGEPRVPPPPPKRVAPQRGPADLFHPIEQAILYDWFGIPRPGHLRDIDISGVDYDEVDSDCVCEESVDESTIEDASLANAVARIVLAKIQDRLPQFYGANREGGYSYGRQYYDKPNRPVELLPQLLFMINWADTAPGISWPESCHAVFVPDFNRIVVTASWDSNDVWGCTELAIGWFDASTKIPAGAKEIITRWWCKNRDENQQEQWAYVWEEGLIAASTAYEWADAVWPDQNIDEDKDR